VYFETKWGWLVRFTFSLFVGVEMDLGWLYEKALLLSRDGFVGWTGSLAIGAKFSELLITDDALDRELGVAPPTPLKEGDLSNDPYLALLVVVPPFI